MTPLFSTATILALLAGVVLPGVSSLLANLVIPVEARALLTMLLSAVSGFVAEWAHDPHGYDWRRGAVTALGTYILAAAARSQFWRKSALDSKLLAVGAPVPQRRRRRR